MRASGTSVITSVVLGSIATISAAAPTIQYGRAAVIDPTMTPPLRITVKVTPNQDFGAGYYFAPDHIEITLPNRSIFDSPLETTLGPRATTRNDSDDYRIIYYDEIPYGTPIGPDMNAIWTGPEDIYWLGMAHLLEPLAEVRQISWKWDCFSRDILSSAGRPGFDWDDAEGFSIAEGEHYIGFRWLGDDSRWRYGWIMFEFERVLASPGGNPDCTYDDPTTFPDVPRVTFGAIAWESEADTPIVAGAGLCEADLNFDAVADFFDVSAFLAAFTDQDPLADFNHDNAYDFFDVSEFLTAYNNGCP